jgi:hypothetical protein
MLHQCLTAFTIVVCSLVAVQAEDKETNKQSAFNTLFGRFGFHSGPIVSASVFGRFGFHSGPIVSASVCSVRMNLDQKTFLDHFQEIQKIGLLNDRLDQSRVYTQPTTLSMGLIFVIIPTVTKNIYEDNDGADKCSFSQTITILDDYGNDKTVPVLTYTFTRAIYQRINWDNFPNQNMIKVAPGFRFSPEFQAMVSDERGR